MNPTDKHDPARNQGEGNRDAARSYEAKLKEFIRSGRVEPAAKDAASAVDGPEGPELRAAEEAGKAPAQTSVVEAMVGVGRALFDHARAKLHHARTARQAKRAHK
jgi:hypothetical protein